jgi:CubicO group peptidase (beta-lactamase class C family)/sugar lactone lactonase YvrE
MHRRLIALFFFVSLASSRGDLSKLVAPGAKVTRLASEMKFTEGPVWMPESDTLVFSDIPNSKLMQWSETGGVKLFRDSENSNGNLLDLDERLLSCQHSGRNVVRTEKDGSITVVVDRYDGKRLNSPNDIAVKSDGTLWFSDPSYGLGKEPGEIEGKWVYRFDPATKAISVVSKHFDMPNGLVFSPDEQRLYISGTGKLGKVLAFDVIAGKTLSDPVFEIDIRSDGMCVDVRGNLYTTADSGIHVFSSKGEKVGMIPVDEQPANVCFGGKAFDELFITARTSLYHIPMRVRGAKKERPTQQAAPTEIPESVGVSSERLARVDALCQEAVSQGKVPGIVALVSRRGKTVLHKAYGMADNEANRALKPDDIFRIASQSKAITSTAVMMLWEEGHFQLDDPISKYIREFKDGTVLKDFNETDGTWTSEPVKAPITIRHLLTHTSGLGYGVIDGDPRMKKIYANAGVTDLFTTEPITIGESVKKLAVLPLHHHPGEKFTYSEGLDVLGYFIEIVSGQTFAAFLEERIFAPLGMRDTGFYQPESKASRLVAVQQPDDGLWARYPVTFYDPDYPIKGAKTFFSGGAGLSSTAKDYGAFLQMYLNGGALNGQRLLSRPTIAVIMANQARDLFGLGEKHHGLAFGVVSEKGQAKGGIGSVGTFDWGGYFNTQYFADPKEGIVGILMKQTQGAPADDTSWRFRQLVGQIVND